MSAGIQLQDLHLRAGGTSLLEGINLSVAPGSFVGVVGPNGAGKTSLLRVILNLVKPSEGSVTVAGEPVGDLPGRERARRLGWLPQQHLVSEPVVALEFVAAARFRFHESRHSALEKARASLEELGVGALGDRTLDTLSGGEAQRVALAALLAQDSEFLLLDEPANHLDPAHQLALYSQLGKQWAAGRGLVCVTHDINLLSYVAPAARLGEVRVLGIKDGRVALDSHMASEGLANDLGALFEIPMTRLSHGDGAVLVPGASNPEAGP